MIIILEGPDNLGKTTLAMHLSDRLNAPIYKPEGTPIRGQDVAVSQAEDRGAVSVACHMADSSDVIFDRSFPSEWVYGKVFGRTVDDLEIQALDIAVSKVPHVVLHVTMPQDESWAYDWARTMAKDGEAMDKEVWGNLYRAYFEYMAKSQMLWKIVQPGDGWLMIESAVNAVRNERPGRKTVFMNMAREVAKRSTCLSRRQGAVLVNAEYQVIATGYNGAPSGMAHQRECPRLRSQADSGQSLDLCNDVHAEENCIVQASLHGASPEGGTIYTLLSPCHRCMRMLINAKISEVVYERLYGDDRALDMAREAGIKMTVRP